MISYRRLISTLQRCPSQRLAMALALLLGLSATIPLFAESEPLLFPESADEIEEAFIDMLIQRAEESNRKEGRGLAAIVDLDSRPSRQELHQNAKGLAAIVDLDSRPPAQSVVEPKANVPNDLRHLQRTSYQELITTAPKVNAQIHFETASAQLDQRSYALLDEYVKALQRQSLAQATFIIAGHTDSVGSERYNQGLSERRAQAVVDYLSAQGVPTQRLLARGFGEAYPVASNADKEGRALNRRSEFYLITPQNQAQP